MIRPVISFMLLMVEIFTHENTIQILILAKQFLIRAKFFVKTKQIPVKNRTKANT